MAILLYELVGRDASLPFSPHCWKARMALAHKGLEFTTVPVCFTAVEKIEGGASRTVPVLRDGETVVADSFAIAEYLEDAYPDRPTLFGGSGGRAVTRFVEGWSQATIHPFVGSVAIMDIHAMLGPDDQAYFRRSREERYGQKLEEVIAGREERIPAFLKRLDPLRATLKLQPFIGGQSPLFSDHIVFGALQWLRITSTFPVFPAGDPVVEWFKRCLDLYEGQGRLVAQAA